MTLVLPPTGHALPIYRIAAFDMLHVLSGMNDSCRQLIPVFLFSHSPLFTHFTSSFSVDSPPLASITPSHFHFQLKTRLIHKYFPLQTLFVPQNYIRALGVGSVLLC